MGKNYADHIQEMNSKVPRQPVLFFKPRSALCSTQHALEISHLSRLGALHHELEIALLIGDTLNRFSDNLLSAVVGVGLGIDLTLRDVQAELKQEGLPWERAKAFDNSCVLSPFLPVDNGWQPNNLELRLWVNEEQKQHSNSQLMLTPMTDLLLEITQVVTLEPGDVVLTGTPAGVGPLQAGDSLRGALNQDILFDKLLVK
ncbi:isomerase/hydrolase [Arenicella chitinivorans]|uniref:Isomerase/hydrolase n=1 Tax=Arenicella chitinivorans TaxID=1329800 RepID=A0A918VKH0_9GAMM|nr:isomerase/hydrolase [Arenicella chitinivorans]